MKRICLSIPCSNEAMTVSNVVDDLRRQLPAYTAAIRPARRLKKRSRRERVSSANPGRAKRADVSAVLRHNGRSLRASAQALNPLRHVLHYAYRSFLAICVVYFLTLWRRFRKVDRKTWRALALSGAFIPIYPGASALASPNTTWRYTMPIYLTSPVFMSGCTDRWLTVRKIPANRSARESA